MNRMIWSNRYQG